MKSTAEDPSFDRVMSLQSFINPAISFCVTFLASNPCSFINLQISAWVATFFSWLVNFENKAMKNFSFLWTSKLTASLSRSSSSSSKLMIASPGLFEKYKSVLRSCSVTFVGGCWGGLSTNELKACTFWLPASPASCDLKRSLRSCVSLSSYSFVRIMSSNARSIMASFLSFLFCSCCWDWSIFSRFSLTSFWFSSMAFRANLWVGSLIFWILVRFA